MEDIKNWESKFQACQYSDQLLNALAYINTKVIIPTDTLIIKKANYYARVYHGSQLRKSGEPYYSHPLIMAYLLALYVGNNKQEYYTTDLIVIAILHDTLEDTKLTYDMIVEIFGKRVAEGVRDLTRLKHAIKTTAADTVNSLFTQYKHDILYVKMFDRTHNMQTIGSMPLEKQKKIIAETVSHFIPMASYLGLHDVKHELIRLYDKDSKTKQGPLGCRNQLILPYKSRLSFPSLKNVKGHTHSLQVLEQIKTINQNYRNI